VNKKRTFSTQEIETESGDDSKKDLKSDEEVVKKKKIFGKK